MVAQPAPFGVRNIVRQASDQHVMSLAFQALGQRDHRVYIASGAKGASRIFTLGSLCRWLAPRPPQSEWRYQ